MNVLALTADRLFDGTGTACLRDAVLRIEGDRIVGVDSGQPPPDMRLHAYPGCTILPGLIDTHVHLVFAALDTNAAIIEQVAHESDEQLLARALANAQAALFAGITTVRDCGGKGRIVQQARDRLRRGEAVGAEILSCGMPITTSLGHCHWLGLVADGQTAAVRAAERMLADDADFLKIMATGGNMTPTSDPMRAQYDDATLLAIADRGRAAGKHTAAHVLSQAALPGAIAANVRTIEHCDWRVEEFRYEFRPELARRMIDQGQYAGLTMAGIARRAFLPEVAASSSDVVRRLDDRFACERQLIDFGVPFNLHTDAGVRLTPIDTIAIGLQTAVIELRLTPTEALRAATASAADAILLGDRGRLRPGLRADVLVVQGDPTRDLAALRQVRAVYQAGQRRHDPRVQSAEGSVQ